MKKILLLSFCILFFTNFSYASYVSIPSEYKNQYKREIERKLKRHIPVYKKEVQDVIREVNKEKDPSSKNAIIDNEIDGVIFSLYMDLIDATERYVRVKDIVPATDYPDTIYPILLYYFQDNNINYSKLSSFLEYAKKKQREIEKKYIFDY